LQFVADLFMHVIFQVILKFVVEPKVMLRGKAVEVDYFACVYVLIELLNLIAGLYAQILVFKHVLLILFVKAIQTIDHQFSELFSFLLPNVLHASDVADYILQNFSRQTSHVFLREYPQNSNY
jgi:hypothetical protein